METGRRTSQDFPLTAEPAVRVVAGLLGRDRRVLLCHRHPARASYPNVWDLPGGHIEADESMPAALEWELVEELGIRAAVPATPPWAILTVDGIELNVFLVDRWLGELRNAAPDEHDELRWFATPALASIELAHPCYHDLLATALDQ
jgi:8-oxo-dGTP diphosphatase